MQLRGITLNGFKTFARRTEVRFDGGLVAIVGPNGSGKSNIVDAFKWVLGETQAKDLRGRTMDEVIYVGGERTPRAAAAEVALVLDNSDGRLPIDFAEVEIKRRVERGGASDYFLNGSRVRRRDLMQLLGSTGLTIDSYSIINQGDIEAIVTASPEQRRQLVEEAAQVRAVKQQRTEAARKMSELAQNLLRLEDVRSELRPRLEALSEQAAAAREAGEAQARLDVLRGSIVWEEWREARDALRRVVAQRQALERRLEETRASADRADAEFQAGRAAMESAQDRRLARQRELGALRLEQSAAEHRLAIASERSAGLAESAKALARELRELESRHLAVAAVEVQLRRDIEAAEVALNAVPADPLLPTGIDREDAHRATAGAEAARRETNNSISALASTRTRRQFLEESVARLESQVSPAEARLAKVSEQAEAARRLAAEAGAAAGELVRLRAELEGLDSLWPSPQPGQQRVGDVLNPEPGYEAALSAVLGYLVEAWVAADGPAAGRALRGVAGQSTVLIPGDDPEPVPGSLYHHVNAEAGHDWLARRLLGRVAVGVSEDESSAAVSLAGVYRERGLVRSGADQRVRLASRRRHLAEQVRALEPVAETASALAARAREIDQELAAIRAAARGRGRLDETLAQLQAARAAETEAAALVSELESRLAAALTQAADLQSALSGQERAAAEHRAECRRLETERLRWRERVTDLQRQLNNVVADLRSGTVRREAREAEALFAATALEGTAQALPELVEAASLTAAAVVTAERDFPEDLAELAEVARRLVSLEEARVEARLRARTLEGNLELSAREAQLLEVRMEEIRARMPMGQAPEDIPGGKAREREMRQLERRLAEIGPTNSLAESEFAEMAARCGTLDEQLADIAAARADLDRLVTRLRAEEDSRYEAVFGAVAAGFQEYFAELTAGGKAALQHVAGEDGPRSGVEILVQPPRKKLQNITLLSSGERALTALALVLALEEVNPSPFMILDEVDAALDDANVARYGDLLQRLGRRRQLLVITHNHVTMASADSLYGIHLDESGRSSLVSVNLNDVKAQGAARAVTA